MLHVFHRSLLALTDTYLWKVMILSAIICTGLFAGFATIVYLLIVQLGLAESWWFSWLYAWLGTGTAIVLGYFLFPLAFPLVTLPFLNSVIKHLEQKHYPQRKGGIPPPFQEEFPNVLRFLIVSLCINLLALPFYLLPGVYYVVNGYLFGREYFEMVGMRYHTAKETRNLCTTMRGWVWLSGILIAVLFTVPFINLIAPILATVFMVHLWHTKPGLIHP